MPQDEIPSAALEFEKADKWNRPRGGSKFTWRQLAQKNVQPFAKPLKFSEEMGRILVRPDKRNSCQPTAMESLGSRCSCGGQWAVAAWKAL